MANFRANIALQNPLNTVRFFYSKLFQRRSTILHLDEDVTVQGMYAMKSKRHTNYDFFGGLGDISELWDSVE